MRVIVSQNSPEWWTLKVEDANGKEIPEESVQGKPEAIRPLAELTAKQYGAPLYMPRTKQQVA
ncbi:MAG: hypothetical protein AMXMBFR7_26590 [Planctomycetota bacterium]|nr:hypothetical protein [Planctomycetota bacterium]